MRAGLGTLAISLGALILALLGEQYGSNRLEVGLIVGRTGQMQDVVDASRTAQLALDDAQMHCADYLRTRERRDLERYKSAVQSWDDEIGTLQLIGAHEPAAPAIRQFSQDGDELIRELAEEVAAVTTSKPDPQSPSVVSVARLRSAGDLARDSSEKLVSREERAIILYLYTVQSEAGWFRRRFAIGAIILYCFVLLQVIGGSKVRTSGAQGVT